MKSLGPTSSRKEQLEQVAGENYGYFTASHAIESGYIQSYHHYHVSHGSWIKVDNGLFRIPGYDNSMEADFTRWCLWSRNQKNQPQAVLSHASALAFHGFAEYVPDEVHLTVPARFRKKTPDGVVLHKESLTLSFIESHGGFMVTRLGRTLADMRAELEEKGEWEEVTGKALKNKKLTPEDVGRLDIATGESIVIGEISSVGSESENASSAAAKNNVGEDGERSGQAGMLDAVSEGVWKMIFDRSEAGRRRARAGFTLVELLVVIAIISILAAMLMPALQKSLASARQITCAGNMKQIGIGISMYVDDSGGWLPYTAHNASYILFINDYLELNQYGGYINTVNRIMTFGKPKGLAFCPSLASPPQSSPCWGGGASTAPYYVSSYMQTISFSNNPKSGCWNNYDSSGNRVYQRMFSAVKDGCVLYTDKNWGQVSGDFYQCGISFPNYAHYLNEDSALGRSAPGWNHNGFANMAFKDFHVKAYQCPGGVALGYFDSDYRVK